MEYYRHLVSIMCLYTIATNYSGLLEAAHAHIDDDTYVMVECGANGQPKPKLFDLSYQL